MIGGIRINGRFQDIFLLLKDRHYHMRLCVSYPTFLTILNCLLSNEGKFDFDNDRSPWILRPIKERVYHLSGPQYQKYQAHNRFDPNFYLGQEQPPQQGRVVTGRRSDPSCPSTCGVQLSSSIQSSVHVQPPPVYAPMINCLPSYIILFQKTFWV